MPDRGVYTTRRNGAECALQGNFARNRIRVVRPDNIVVANLHDDCVLAIDIHMLQNLPETRPARRQTAKPGYVAPRSAVFKASARVVKGTASCELRNIWV
jgi:hypothetical protein